MSARVHITIQARSAEWEIDREVDYTVGSYRESADAVALRTARTLLDEAYADARGILERNAPSNTVKAEHR